MSIRHRKFTATASDELDDIVTEALVADKIATIAAHEEKANALVQAREEAMLANQRAMASKNERDRLIHAARMFNRPTGVLEVDLAEQARIIRAAGARAIGDFIVIGRALTKAKELCGHGLWLPWLEREFGWSDETARRYMQVASLGVQNPQLVDFDIEISGLYLLAKPSTPDAAREAVLEAANAGVKVTLAKAKEVIATKKAAAKPETLNDHTNTHTRAVSPEDTALKSFTERVADLVQRISNHKPERFVDTTISSNTLLGLSDFFSELACAKQTAKSAVQAKSDAEATAFNRAKAKAVQL